MHAVLLATYIELDIAHLLRCIQVATGDGIQAYYDCDYALAEAEVVL